VAEEAHQEEAHQAAETHQAEALLEEAHQEEATQVEEHQEVDLPAEGSHPHNKPKQHNQDLSKLDHNMNPYVVRK
jgi:hypothetical protein